MSIGDHSEAVQIDYDPAVISFEKLLDVFWESHNPCAASWSKQYQTILFYSGSAQKKVAEKSRDAMAQKLDQHVRTELRPLRHFYLAEDYHQKWSLRRNRALTTDLMKIYPGKGEFVKSTAAARVNAYLAGYLEYPQLRTALAKLGLRALGDRKLEHIERAEAIAPEDRNP